MDKEMNGGVPVVVQQKRFQLVSKRMQVRALASLSGLRILCFRELWLWRRPAAAALIQTLAWELPYAAGAALKRQKKERKETNGKVRI